MRQRHVGAALVPKSDAQKAIEQLAKRENADIFVYNAAILTTRVERLRTIVCAKKPRCDNAILFLTTLGGDPDAAFRLAACMRRKYKSFAAYVFGPCKSAGTLAATGADRIVLGDFGELGPLDVQMTKPDEIYATGSGLDIFQAVGVLTNSAFEAFQQYLGSIIVSSEGHISAKTSAEIARELAVGLFAPMTGQIEPERLGEMQRAITIATEYGKRLTSNKRDNLKKDALERLVQGYPGHGFVIDIDEAKTLFTHVREPTILEHEVARFLPGLRRPSAEPVIQDLLAVYAPPTGAGNAASKPKKAGTRSARRGVQSGTGGAGNVEPIRPNTSGDGTPAEEDSDPRRARTNKTRPRPPRQAAGE
jgi:hypothetical protein